MKPGSDCSCQILLIRKIMAETAGMRIAHKLNTDMAAWPYNEK